MFRLVRAPVEPPRGWWNHPWFLGALVMLSAVPLLWPAIPPFTDLPEHMGRYRIELADPASALRTIYFQFRWHFLANLGVDLLIVPVAALFGLELGVKLIVIGTVLLTATGILWMAREAHGRVPPTALFALPLTYNFAVIWGFLNFMLSMALALNAFALWLRLGRQGRLGLRAGLFVPIGLAITTAHVFGWALLGLLAFAGEIMRVRDNGSGFWRALWRGGLSCLPLAPPLLLLLIWRSGDVAGKNADWFFWYAKYLYLASALRSTTMPIDLGTVIALLVLIAWGALGLWFGMNRALGVATILLAAAYALLPQLLLNSAYADMRLAPYLLLVGVAAVGPKSPSRRLSGVLATVATILFAGRIALHTADFARRDAGTREQLAALAHVRPGSRVFVQVALPCLYRWTTTRRDHLGAMAIVRRGAFANGQWTDPGAQLVRITYAPAKGYAEDPTEILRPFRCRQGHAKLYPQGLNALPREAFDYVWLIDMPQENWHSFPGLEPIWFGPERGILYRVVPPAGSATSPIEMPAGQRPRTAA